MDQNSWWLLPAVRQQLRSYDDQQTQNASAADQLFNSLQPNPNAEPTPELKSATKLADALHNHMATVAGDMGINPLGTSDAWKMKSAAQKIGAAQGYVQQLSIAQMMARTRLQEQEAAANDATGNIAQQLLKQVNVPTDPLTGQPMTNDPNTAALVHDIPAGTRAVLQAIGNSGAMNSRAGASLLTPLIKNLIATGTATGEDAENPLVVDTNSVPGATVVMRKHGNEFQVRNNAPDLTQGAQPMTSPDGNLLGYNIPTGAGKYQFVKSNDLTTDQRENLALQHQKAISSLMAQIPMATGQTNLLAQINDEIGQHRDAIGKLRAKAAPVKGAPKVGEVRRGYKFTGGDPADQNSWEPVQ